MEGYAREKDNLGHSYEGKLIKGQASGEGIAHYKESGDRYEGTYEDNLRHGKGLII
jgi:hypothetical protein